ncbi:MAG: AAA family ATPase [Phycisphaerales bacterium]|nr:AAA family ATPase [Phycisphaerales bacterium]
MDQSYPNSTPQGRGDELFPFSISRRSPKVWRIFDGDRERLVEADPSASDFAKTLLGAVWELRGREKDATDVGYVNQAAAWLAEGDKHVGPSDDDLIREFLKAHPGSRAVLTCMADVESREIAWLWPGRIPLGRITLLAGRPGEGKSFCIIDMAARITTGTPWPDGSECPVGSVIFITAEDDPGDTIRPRLDAHYADVRKVHLLSAVRRVGNDGQPYNVLFKLEDVAALESALRATPDCRMIVIDPIGSFLGGSTDSHRDNEVREILTPVAKLVENGPAVVVVAHVRKGSGSRADDLVLGTRAFTGIARAVWHVMRDSQNKLRREFLPGKNNLAPEGTGLAFAIEGTPAAVIWEADPVNRTADDALAQENSTGDDAKPGPKPESLEQEIGWLTGVLADLQEHPAGDIQTSAKEAGLQWRRVQKASQQMGVSIRRRGFGGGSVWQLPQPAPFAPAIRADTVENEKPVANGANGDFSQKTEGLIQRECHSRRDISLGANGADTASGGDVEVTL